MGPRIGAGFRLIRHTWIGYTVPLAHARRLASHEGHGSGNPAVGLIRPVVIYALIKGPAG
jgi:hypothetical protein